MAVATLTPEYIGRLQSGTGIYRIDLSQSGLASIKSITIQDDNILSGKPGSSSGFDIDFVNISSTLTGSVAEASVLPSSSYFDFNRGTGVDFEAGFVTGGDGSTNLNGTINTATETNAYARDVATLYKADGARLSLGEGGFITFELRQDVTTAGNYLYFGDSGCGNDNAFVKVSDGLGGVPGGTGGIGGGVGGGTGVTPGPVGFNLVGTNGPDTIRLGVGANSHIGAGDDIIYGKGGKDWLAGAGGNDKLYGGPGRDKLVAGMGDDRLYGSTDIDNLYGGMGKDAFVFNSKASATNWDHIRDFKSVDDSIWLDNSVYRSFKRGGTEDAPVALKKAAFFTGDAAHDASDRIIYQKSTGTLYYDADGTGAGAQVKFAQVKANTKVFYHDIFII